MGRGFCLLVHVQVFELRARWCRSLFCAQETHRGRHWSPTAEIGRHVWRNEEWMVSPYNTFPFKLFKCHTLLGVQGPLVYDFSPRAYLLRAFLTCIHAHRLVGSTHSRSLLLCRTSLSSCRRSPRVSTLYTFTSHACGTQGVFNPF